MSVYTQQGRWLELSTPLGEDALLIRGFTAEEEISRLYRFQLELVSTQPDIDSRRLIGHPILIRLRNLDDSIRPFHGFVSRFSYRGTDDRLSIYHAEVVPWTWFLSQSRDCRIFQNKTIPQIIETVFKKYGAKDFEFRITSKHPTWDYCVQYRESDFDFVSRLMEQEGIYYYFRHENNRHVMVLADSRGGYLDCPESRVSFADNLSGGDLEDKVTQWEHSYAFRPSAVTQIDYNFEKPTANLASQVRTVLPLDGAPKTELYDFPGEYEHKEDGDTDTRIRMEEVEAAYDTASGQSKCRTFFPGGRFTLTDHHSALESDKQYVLLSVRHEAIQSGGFVTGGAAAEFDYRNRFTCMPSNVTFRPERRTAKPQIKGIQTATVVGPKGQEVYLDKHGRVKVQFHWDREGKRNENSSCWIRVAQAAAGPNFGFVVHPRIGYEVVVHFLEGDPDRPLVMGCVYNANSMPNPSNAGRKTPGAASVDQAHMMTSIKSNSLGGSGGHNEITMNDTGGGETFFMKAQKDHIHNVGNDKISTIAQDETKSIGRDSLKRIGHNLDQQVGANKSEQIKANKFERVGGDKVQTILGSFGTSVGGVRTIDVKGSHNTTIGTTRKASIGTDDSTSVGASQTTTVGTACSVSAGSELSLDCTPPPPAPTSVPPTSSGGVVAAPAPSSPPPPPTPMVLVKLLSDGTLTQNAKDKITIDAENEIVLKCGAASISMKKDGTIEINGKTVAVQATAGDLTLKGGPKVKLNP